MFSDVSSLVLEHVLLPSVFSVVAYTLVVDVRLAKLSSRHGQKCFDSFLSCREFEMLELLERPFFDTNHFYSTRQQFAGSYIGRPVCRRSFSMLRCSVMFFCSVDGRPAFCHKKDERKYKKRI
jgi:hypothetical protein